MQEAALYKIDFTRSRGKMLVGAGVREEAGRQVEELMFSMQPLLLPGVLDDADRAAGEANSSAVGKREEYLQRFLQQTTVHGRGGGAAKSDGCLYASRWGQSLAIPLKKNKNKKKDGFLHTWCAHRLSLAHYIFFFFCRHLRFGARCGVASQVGRKERRFL
ncbi:Rhodanese-like protein [Trypanosoma rangeli]|uniref:Rhodanese-like protein n=1 Tax=Trypanosoma rangeli TaxID=5698 RepID=A0A3R7KCF6_TRYRA|nr:Rhodanese-like protein [Trypanosoma rangeli]RNE97758.1 Rhodanese-like protein [Trypanosoma rangeli]|eukprot:RNE97758.1 Rhodanese-like protein [Trypanosoma rangeli]